MSPKKQTELIHKLTEKITFLESRVSLLYSLELERNRIRIKKESLKQREQREGYENDYHEGHEPQDGFVEPDYEDNLSDAEADAQTLASAGWGSDEDYGGTDERL